MSNEALVCVTYESMTGPVYGVGYATMQDALDAISKKNPRDLYRITIVLDYENKEE